MKVKYRPLQEEAAAGGTYATIEVVLRLLDLLDSSQC
jgi:hypothetical protein